MFIGLFEIVFVLNLSSFFWSLNVYLNLSDFEYARLIHSTLFIRHLSENSSKSFVGFLELHFRLILVISVSEEVTGIDKIAKQGFFGIHVCSILLSSINWYIYIKTLGVYISHEK